MQGLMRLILILALAMSAALPARAENWVLIADNGSGSRAYIDPSTISRPSAGNVRVATRYEVDKPLQDGDITLKVAMSLYQIDCVTHTAALLAIEFVGVDDRRIPIGHVARKWAPIRSG